LLKYHRPSKAQSQLEKDEPFTKREIRTLDKRERNFIRGIQLKDKTDKKTAIKRYHDYLIGNIKNRKLFRKRINEAIRNTYPKSREMRINRLTVVKRQKKIAPRRKKEKIYEVTGYDYSRVY
jgi:hypothetical protein